MTNQEQTTNESFPFEQHIVWQPNPDWVATSNLRRFMDAHGIGDYDRLARRAVEDITWFWDAVIKDLGVEFSRPYTQVVDLSQGIEFPRWCVGGELNIVYNCLDKWQTTPVRNRAALRWEGEEGARVTLTYGDLHQEVCRCANALRSLGLGKGDAVGLYMPMIPELAIAFLAVIKIGGVILPLFSGYGHSAVVSRLADADAKAVITADGLYRRGQSIAMKHVIDQAVMDVPSLQHVIVVKRIGLADVRWTRAGPLVA